MGFFDKLKSGLEKTRESFSGVFSSFKKVDEEFLEELEEILIMSDIGVETSTKIISNLRERVKKERIEDEEAIKNALREEMKRILESNSAELNMNTRPSVILVVGVNGVRKDNINWKNSK